MIIRKIIRKIARKMPNIPHRRSPNRPFGLARTASLLLLLLLPLLFLGGLEGCGRSGKKNLVEGSALWLDGESRPLSAADLKDLQKRQIRRLLVPFAAWEGSPESPLEKAFALPQLPRRTSLTLVVRGRWRPGLEPETVAEHWLGQLKVLALLAETEGFVPAGFHFEAAGAEKDLEAFGETLRRVRRGLKGRHELSVSVDPAWLEEDGIVALAQGVDFLIAWIYGQRPEALATEGFLDELWDLQQVDLALRRLETVGSPYLVAVVTSGATLHLDRGGGVREMRPGGLLFPLATHGGLHLRQGFVLSGLDCRRYDFEAQKALKVDGWSLEKGEALRLVSLGSGLLRAYERLLPALDLRQRLGDLYYRLPAAADGLSLTYDSLLAALDGREPPAYQAEVFQERGGRQLRVRLSNPSEEASGVASVDANYLEIELAAGAFGSVRPGAFSRYQTLLRRAGHEDRTALRSANVLRLFAPVLDGGQTLESGALEVRGGAGKPGWRLRFLGPEGRIVELDDTAPAADRDILHLP
jgi:hypothetical protein